MQYVNLEWLLILNYFKDGGILNMTSILDIMWFLLIFLYRIASLFMEIQVEILKI